MTTITNRGDWNRQTTVTTSGGVLTAGHVRQFVKHLDEAGIPDDALVEDQHANDTRRLQGLSVRVTDTRPDDEVPA